MADKKDELNKYQSMIEALKAENHEIKEKNEQLKKLFKVQHGKTKEAEKLNKDL